MIGDPIGDFLTRIRNAQLRRKAAVIVPSSSIVSAIVEILKSENFISDYRIVEDKVQDKIEVFLRYVDKKPVIRNLERISKPGIRKYSGYKEIKDVKRGMGIAILSTPLGVMTGKDAVDKKVGGELICEIY